MEEIKKKAKKISGIAVGAIVFALGLVGIYIALFWVSPKIGGTKVELGSELSTNIKYYMIGTDWALSHCEIDLGNVDTSKVGTYYITCSRSVSFLGLGHENGYAIKVKVVDTTAPTVSLKDDMPMLAVGQQYSGDVFVGAISDLSEELGFTYEFKTPEPVGEETASGDAGSVIMDFFSSLISSDSDGDEAEILESQDESVPDMVVFNEAGQYELTVSVIDAYGNATDVTVSFIVSNGPMFVHLNERTVKLGTALDPLKGVVAIDVEDGDVTGKITCDDTNFDETSYGDYEIYYSVEDSDGLVTTESVVIHVANDTTSDPPLSEDDMEKLLRAGYFAYEPLTTANSDDAGKIAERSVVAVEVKDGDALYRGSAFVYDITTEYVYFLSVDHITGLLPIGGELTLYNGITEKVKCTSYIYSKDQEISMFRVPVDNLSVDGLLSLKKICVDSMAADNLETAEKVISLGRDTSGRLIAKKAKIGETTVVSPPWNDTKYLFSTSFNTEAGMSGGPTIDGYGRLVGIVEGHENSMTKSYHLKIMDLSVLTDQFPKE